MIILRVFFFTSKRGLTGAFEAKKREGFVKKKIKRERESRKRCRRHTSSSETDDYAMQFNAR